MRNYRFFVKLVLAAALLTSCNQASGPDDRISWKFHTFPEQKLWHGDCYDYVHAPVVSEEFVFAVGGYQFDTKVFLYALDRLTGKLKWKQGPYKYVSSLKLENNKVKITTSSSVGSETNLRVFNQNNGKAVYSKVVPPEGRTVEEYVGYPDIQNKTSKLLMHNLTAYYSVEKGRQGSRRTRDFRLYAYDPVQRKLKWERASSAPFSNPQVFDDVLYTSDVLGKSRLHAISLLTGEAIWSTPVRSGWKAHFVNSESYLHLTRNDKFIKLSKGTGEIAWKFDSGGPNSAPTIFQGQVFFGSSDCNIYALKLD